MSQSRQLAAIMFTDIAGYTSLMEKDEKRAIELLKTNREIHKSFIEKYRGRWIKEMGDGVLASFSTVTDAVMCAGAIQKATENIPDLKLRIGLHLGEVVFENNDVFGDGVNIASRLQALAPSGGIFVSEAIYKNVINKKEITSEFIREEILKNVSASVKIYEVKVESFTNSSNQSSSSLENNNNKPLVNTKKIVIGIGILAILGFLVYYFANKPKQAVVEVKSEPKEKAIAVLPFVNMSNDPQQEYFSDGLSEELINMFTKIPDLKVIGRTSSFAFKGKNEDLRTIGQKLGVQYLLEGSVRKSGNKIRITAQLIKADDGTHLWSETYDKELNNIFEVQDQISTAITNELHVTLMSNSNPVRQTNINPDAYNDFLQGRFFYEESNDPKNDARALKCFQDAIKKDSTFSLPWSYVSMLYWRKTFSSTEKDFKQAKDAVNKALQLDPSSGIALVNAAELMDNEYDFKGALEKIELAYKLEPENPYVLRNVGRFYTLIGRREESIRICKKALEKDPIQTTSLYYLIKAYYYSEDIKSIKVLLKDSVESLLLSDNVFTNLYLQIHSIEESEKAIVSFTDTAFQLYAYTIINFNSGKKKESTDYLNKLIKQYPQYSYLIAIALSKIGENEKSIDWLEKAYQQRNNKMVYVNVEPEFRGLRNNPRFNALLKKMNFPE